MLAAGAAARFGDLKQLAALGGRRLVDRAVETAASVCDAVVLVLPAGVAWDGAAVSAVVTGGSTRGDSVRAGLAAVAAAAEIVVVHDAAHPLAGGPLFEAVIARVRAGADGAVPALAVTETIALVAGDVLAETVPRPGLAAIQMPHAFRADALRRAHASGVAAADDASLIVALGGTVAVVPGEAANVHVTTPAELAMAERLLASP